MPQAAHQEQVRDVVAPVVRAAGLYLEGVRLAPAGRRTVVRVVVDLEADQRGALDLDTLADVSRAVGDALDESGVVRGEHTLEVTTPGTDRPLAERRHYLRARGRLVRLVLVGGEAVTDRLEEVDGESITLAGGRTVELADVARGQVEVELTRDRDDDGDGG